MEEIKQPLLGTATVVLDGGGKKPRFLQAAGQTPPGRGEPFAIDERELLKVAGLPWSGSEASEPTRLPPVFAERVKAWRVAARERTANASVTAASLAGRVVYFRSIRRGTWLRSGIIRRRSEPNLRILWRRRQRCGWSRWRSPLLWPGTMAESGMPTGVERGA